MSKRMVHRQHPDLVYPHAKTEPQPEPTPQDRSDALTTRPRSTAGKLGTFFGTLIALTITIGAILVCTLILGLLLVGTIEVWSVVVMKLAGQ